MIFTPERIQAILEGRKTQTRRVARDDERLYGFERHTSNGYEEGYTVAKEWDPDKEWMPRPKWQTGRTYAVQPGRGKPAVARIRITGIRRERLQDISEEDVLAEGCGLVRWAGEDEEGWPATAGYAELWDSLNTRKGTRWSDNPSVWVLSFEVVPDSVKKE